jgi:hypothetical protein
MASPNGDSGMIINRDGLSDAEFEEALAMAHKLFIKHPTNTFYADCYSYAKNRMLTRKQLEALRKCVREKQHLREDHSREPVARWRRGNNRRPGQVKVTLAEPQKK